jgi:hypothetical protein
MLTSTSDLKEATGASQFAPRRRRPTSALSSPSTLLPPCPPAAVQQHRHRSCRLSVCCAQARLVGGSSNHDLELLDTLTATGMRLAKAILEYVIFTVRHTSRSEQPLLVGHRRAVSTRQLDQWLFAFDDVFLAPSARSVMRALEPSPCQSHNSLSIRVHSWPSPFRVSGCAPVSASCRAGLHQTCR